MDHKELSELIYPSLMHTPEEYEEITGEPYDEG